MWRLPISLLRWLYSSTNHEAWRGFRAKSQINVDLTIRSPVTGFICFYTSSEYLVVNLSSIESFPSPFKVRSNSWKKWVILVGTDTTTIFRGASFDKTFSIFKIYTSNLPPWRNVVERWGCQWGIAVVIEQLKTWYLGSNSSKKHQLVSKQQKTV